jgi:uncharacterized protein
MTHAFVSLESLRASGLDGGPTAGESRTPAPWMHLVPGPKPLVFVVDGSRLYEVAPDLYAGLSAGEEASLREFREAVHGPGFGPGPDASPGDLAEPVSLTLNVAQACNLSCSYCYADEGRFGGPARLMEIEVALAAIDRLLAGAAGRRVTVGFIGGEPFLNRPLIHKCVDHARGRGRELKTPVGFSITTNATLLTPADLDLLRRDGFSVSVSLDGVGVLNDRHRRDRRGSSSARAIQAVRPLLDDPSSAKVAARVTVPRDDLRVLERVEALAGIGFREVGVSPLRSSAQPGLRLMGEDWPAFLAEMIRAAEAEWDRVRRGGAWRFSNLAITLKELHRGSCRPLPCGAANGYVSLGADGGYFTCHRAIDDPRYRLGSLADGLDREARDRFLKARHVDRQEPCRSCWARYLCGGGCHVEVLAEGRTGCDYVLGWLDYCLGLYDKVLTERPDLLPPDRVEARS